MTLRFTWIRLDNWRNFTKAEVELQRRVFLVGPNASGKSNLLDAFRFLRDVASVGGGFQDAVDRRGGVTRLRSLAARRSPEVGMMVTLGDDQDPNIWTYELRFGVSKANQPILKREQVLRGDRVLVDRPDNKDRDDPALRSQTALEQVQANREFRQIAEFFSDVRYRHVVPQLIREPDRSVNHPNDPFGGDFLDQVAQTPKKTRDSRLKKINSALRTAVPQLTELQLQTDARGRWHLEGRYQHWRPHGARQNEFDFSDGTLRLIGLLWAVLDGSGPLLLEEPEMSLHPEVVRHLPTLIARVQRRSGRQVLISSHSGDLIADPGIGLDEVLLLEPGDNGTVVHPAAEIKDARILLEGGSTLPEIVHPRTRPQHVDQLALFQAS